MSAKRPLTLSKQMNVLLLFLAVAAGVAAGVSFSFHIGIAQHLSRLDKVFYFLFAAIPFSMLFFLVLRQLARMPRKGSWLLFLVPALLLGLGLVFFAYPEVKPVRQHTVIITLPVANNADEAHFLTVTAAQIQDDVIQPLSLAQLHVTGNTERTGEGIRLRPDSSLSLSAQYSGNLKLHLTPSNCPMPLEIIVDNKAYSRDACNLDPAEGLTFAESGSGTLTPRWALLLQLLKGLDLFLFTLLAAALLLMFHWLYSQLQRGGTVSRDPVRLIHSRLLLDSAIVLTLVTGAVLLANLLNVVLLLPLLVFLLFDYLSLVNPNYLNRTFLLYSTIVGFFIIAIVLNVTGHALYSSYLRPIPLPRQDKTNSFNALVLGVFNGFEDSLLYGYDNVLRGRQLVLSSRTTRLLGSDADLKAKLQLSELLIEEFDPQISRQDFEQLLVRPHRTWDSGKWYRFYFTDEKDYQPAEAVVAREYEDWILLLPASVSKSLGGQK